MAKEIGIRIKKLRKENKYSQQFIAEKLKISQSAYSLIESSHNNVMTNHVLKLSKLYNVSTDYILRGRDKLLEVNTENGFIPFINIEAVAGDVNLVYSKQDVSHWDWYRIPNYKVTDRDLIFEVEGDSMQPTLYPKDTVICEAKESLNDFSDNALVVVAIDKGLLIKRLKKGGDDYCILQSDNEDYDPIKIPIKDLKAILSVKGKITNRLNKPILKEDIKFKSIEDNIRHLETQIARLSQYMP